MGAYALVRGVSFFLKGFPEEQLTFMLIKYREYNQLDDFLGPKFYAYLGSIVFLTIFGMIIQSCLFSPEPAKNPEQIEKANVDEEKDKIAKN